MKVLEINQLEKSFGENKVLKGINLTAEKGDVVSIIGSSGSGKSTMLRCINFLETPNKGIINVCGEIIDCAQAKLDSPNKQLQSQIITLRKKLGMVFQSFNLWSHMNILDNITEAPIHVLGKEKEIAEIADVLGVNIEKCSINGGIPYVSSGILANDHCIVVGSLTNGPEIMNLTKAFLN